MSIYAYMRTSTKTQARRNGCQLQRYLISEYCENENITINDWFEDNGITGTILDRPALIELLRNLENNDTIIVAGISRLWRDSVVAIAIKEICRSKKVNIIDIDHPDYSIYDDSDNLLGELYNQYVEFQNFLNKNKLVNNFAVGRKSRAKTGHKPCGKTPYGYKWNKNSIETNPIEQPIVKEIFEKYIEFQSLSKVKKYCNDKGYRTSTGKEFSKQALSNIITNDFYIGVLTYDGKKTAGEQPVFIDKDIFDKANESLKGVVKL